MAVSRFTSHQVGVGGLFVNGDVFGAAIACVANSEGRAGGAVDDCLQVAGHSEAGAVGPLQGDDPQALGVVPHIILYVGGAVHHGLGNIGAAQGPDGHILAGGRIDLQLLGNHIVQQDAVLANLGLAAAGYHNAAQHPDIVQQHIAQAHAAGEVQVASNHSVPQGDMGGVDGHIAEHPAQTVVAGGVDEGAQGAGKDAGHLAPGDVAFGAKAAVWPAADNARQQGRAHIGGAPGAEIAAVGELGDLAPVHLQAHGVANEHQGLLSGDLAVGRGLGGRGAGHDALVIGSDNVVVIPGATGHVGKGDGPAAVKAVGPVEHGHHLRPGDGPVFGHAGAVAGHNAQLPHLLHILGGPGGAGLGGEVQLQGQRPQHHDRAQKQSGQPFQVSFQCIHRSTFLCKNQMCSDRIGACLKTAEITDFGLPAVCFQLKTVGCISLYSEEFRRRKAAADGQKDGVFGFANEP